MENKIALIFDIDGTLVDVTDSYLSTILLASYIYSQNILGIKELPTLDNWFTKDFIADLKKLLGFNNDYTCTSILIDFLLSIIKPEIENTESIPLLDISFHYFNVKSIQDLKQDWIEYVKEIFLGNSEMPEKILEKSQYKQFIKNAGTISGSNYIERIFQEIYFGSVKFKEYFGLDAKFYTTQDGYYQKEQLLIPIGILDILTKTKMPLGICTGRPKEDLDLFLSYFNLQTYFSDRLVITLTDVLKEEERINSKKKLSKPNPWGLQEIKRKMVDKDKILMIGDSQDDLVSAFKSGLIPVLYNINNKEIDVAFDYKTIVNWSELLEIIDNLNKGSG